MTDLAVIQKRQGSAQDLVLKDVYVAMACSFGLLLLVAGAQTYRAVTCGTWRTYLGNAHLIISGVALARIISCIWLSDSVSGFRTQDCPRAALLLVIAIPYSLIFWVYTLVAFQWIAVVHNVQLSHQPFQGWKKPYTVLNICFTVGSWIILGCFIFSKIPHMKLVGSVSFSIPYILTSLLIITYGLRISLYLHKLQRSISPQRNNKRKTGLVSPFFLLSCSVIVSVGLCSQGVLWVTGSFLHNGKLAYATLAFLLIDIVNLSLLLSMYWRGVNKLQREAQASHYTSSKSQHQRLLRPARRARTQPERSRIGGNRRSRMPRLGRTRHCSRSGLQTKSNTDCKTLDPRLSAPMLGTRIGSNHTSFGSEKGMDMKDEQAEG
ncbi:hypothetical protein AAMO2058_000238500 [Amorphochlora amoebiformis]